MGITEEVSLLTLVPYKAQHEKHLKDLKVDSEFMGGKAQ